MNLKSQTGMEFLIISGVALFILTSFFLVINTNIEEKNREAEILLIKNLGVTIADEISIAFKSSDGYNRNFLVPEKIGGEDYEVFLISNTVYIETANNAISLSTKEVEGDLKKGENRIEKTNGIVYLNP